MTTIMTVGKKPFVSLFMGLLVAILVSRLWEGQAWAAQVPFSTKQLHLTIDQRTQILAEANQAYTEGQRAAATDQAEAKESFAVAVDKYQTLVDSGVENGQLFFNLGNAYLQRGSLGYAMANYERARHLLPDNAQVVANLAHVKSLLGKEGMKTTTARWWSLGRLNRALPLSVRLVLAVAAWTLIWVVLATRLYVRRFAWKRYVMPAACLLVLSAVSLAYQMTDDSPAGRGIVTGDAVLLRCGNGVAFAAERSEVLAEGATFEVLEKRGDWLYIRCVDGSRGWIPAADAQLVDLCRTSLS